MSPANSDSSLALGDVVERATAAYRALAVLAETVEDEWQYVNDLVDAYLPALQSLAEPGPESTLPVKIAAAVDEAVAEIAEIRDAHRAIDWLSTFPHLVGLALGADVDTPRIALAEEGAPAGAAATAAETDEDDDSPFRLLLGREGE